MRQENQTPITRLTLLLSLGISNHGMSYGEIRCDHLPFTVPFWGLGDCMGEIERICDYLNFPQAWESRRRLCKPSKDLDTRALLQQHWDAKEFLTDEEQKHCGNYFSIQVFCRQHSSIQGMLQVKKERVPFRSAMELMTLLNDALGLDLGYRKRPMLTPCPLPLHA